MTIAPACDFFFFFFFFGGGGGGGGGSHQGVSVTNLGKGKRLFEERRRLSFQFSFQIVASFDIYFLNFNICTVKSNKL